MGVSAPKVRRVDALSGATAPTKFFQALSEADDFIARADGRTPSLADRMRAAADAIEELNAMSGLRVNAPVHPDYLRDEADRMDS